MKKHYQIMKHHRSESTSNSAYTINNPNNFTARHIVLLIIMVMMAWSNSALAQTVTATWNFRSGGNMWSNASANNLYCQGTEFSNVIIPCDRADIALRVDASSGKFYTQGRSDWAQINNGTKIYVPVVSTDDRISVAMNSGNSFSIGETAIAENTKNNYEVTVSDVSKGYVLISCTANTYLGSITAELHNNVSFTAKWDWVNNSLTSIEGKDAKGNIESDCAGVSLYAYGKTEEVNVKITDRGGDAQFNDGTILRIPIKSVGDKITVVSYPGYHNYKISGEVAQKDTEVYTVKNSDVTTGYVEIESSGAYLYSITLEHKQLYDFALPMNGTAPFFGSSVEQNKPYYVVASPNGVAYMTDTRPDNYAAEMSFKTYNGGEHGYENMVANIPVLPGRYDVTIGNCGVSANSGKYALTIDHGTVTPTLIDAGSSTNCYHQNIETNKTTETITITEAGTLHIQYGGSGSIYTPYFAISKINESGHTLDVTIDPENAGSVAAAGGKYPAGPVELRAVAKTGYQFVKWTTDDDTELSTENPYNYDMPDEDVTLKAVFEALSSYTLSFSAGDVTGIEGTMPADVVLYSGETYTVPDNQTLYKEGYTFTGWTDGETTWNVGDEIPAATKTLNPVFTQNTTDIANRTGAVTVKWDFQTKAKAPLIQVQGSTAFLVTQATIDTKKVDVKLSIDATSGKYDNQNGNWAQVNSGTKFYFPSAKGAVVTAFVYKPVVASGTTIDNQQPAMIGDNNAKVTVNTAKNTNELVVGSDIEYIRSITIDFPAKTDASDLTAKTTAKTMMVGKEYTITGADYTTSSAGAFSYTSSNESVATVDATGKITALAEGTSTITVTQAPDNTYAGSSFNITVTVEAVPTAFVAVWDWENTIPSTIRANYSTGGLINSSVDGAESTKYQLEIQNGNVSGAGRDNLYVNNGVEVKIPVVSVGDLIEVKFHTYESTWQRTTIDGKAIEDNQFIKHYVTSEDAEREYAILKANGGGLYLYSIKLIHNQLTTFNEISYTFPKDGTSTGVILDGTGTKVTSVPVDGYIGAYFTAETTNNSHGHTGIDLAIPVLKGTYNLKLGQCFYNVHGYTVKTTDGISKDISVTKAKSSVDKTCYDNSHKELVVPVKISLSNDGYILVSGGSQSYLPFFSVTKLAVPTITVQPRATAQMTQGDAEGVELSINAIDTDDWSYQWYTCDAEGNNPQPIDGATSASYTYHSDTPGTYYLYCALEKDEESVTSAISTVTVMESRTFVDFKIDFRARPTADDDYTKVEPAEELPAGEFTFVSQEKETQYAQHGAHQPVFKVTVDGPVRFKIAQSHNANATDFTVAVTGTGVNETLNNYGTADAKPADLASATYNNYITYIYNEEPASPVELTFTCSGYLSYIIAEKIRKATEYDVSYYNPDGSAIGEAIKTPAGSTLFFKKTASDVTVGTGKKFRGWFDSTADNANKIAEGIAVTANMNLYAKATDEETSEPGNTYNFDFTKGIYDFTNHDIIKTNSGNGRSDGHGWEFKKAGGSMSVYVPGDAKLSFTICRYTNAQNITVTDGEGNQVGETFVFAKEDEQVKEIVVERNYTGPATWLSFNYATSGFIHDVTITNLALSDLTKIKDIDVETKLSHTLTKDVDYSTSSDGALTFSSDNDAVATVSPAGVISGISVGTANVTLTQAASDTHRGSSITFAVTVTKSNINDGHALTLGQDIKKLTGTNANWASTVVYPKTFAVQGQSFGDGDGSNEATHVSISDVGSIYFDVTQGSNNNGGLSLRTWIWDGGVKTLFPHPLDDYATATADTWLAEYRIQNPGVYRVNVNAFDHLKGVKANNNWGADPLTVDFAFTEGLDNSEGTIYNKESECLATGDANTIPEGWTVYSDGELRAGGTGWGSGGRIFDSKDGKGVYTRANGGEGSVKTTSMHIPSGNVELRALLAYWSNPSDVTITVHNANTDAVVATKRVTTGGAAEATRNNADFKFPEVAVRFNATSGDYYVKYTLNTEGFAGMYVGGQKVFTYTEPTGDGQQQGPSFPSAEQGSEYIFIAHDYGTEYQWYEADNEGLTGATPIAGAVKPYIRYTANEYGNHYIYCMVTNGEAKTRTGYAFVNVPMPPVRFTTDLDDTYEVTKGNYSLTLTVEAVAGLMTPDYQWYVNFKNDNPDEATPISGETNESYKYTANDVDNAWVFCKATHMGSSEISTVAKITATEFVFKNFELDLTDKDNNILTTGGEQWIVVPKEGAIYSSDVEPGMWNMHVITATPHNDKHGFTSFKAEVPVTGAVAITIGGCNYNGGSSNITVTAPGVNISGPVPSENNDKNCYHQTGHPSGTVYYTLNTPTVLTITGPGYTPYISVRELTSVVKTPAASTVQAVGRTTVTLTCETDGATIYYKVNDGEKQTYTAPIVKTENCTLTYWAEKEAMANSDVQEYEVKIIDANSVAYIYDSKYSTYCGLDKDPIYKALSENTTDWTLIPFDINGLDAEDVTKLDAFSALVVSEAQSGSGDFGMALKDIIGTKPMVSMKTFFMGNGTTSDRWKWGSAFNPEHDGKGVSVINVNEDYRGKSLFEGVMFDDTETSLFNTDAEQYVKANHLQGIKEFSTEVTPFATVTGTDGTVLTTIFAKGDNFINIGISCDNITEINQNGIRIVENALKIVKNGTGWTTDAAEGSIITGISYEGGKVDAIYMGALSNGELAVQKEKPASITITTQNGTTVPATSVVGKNIFTFNFNNKEYSIGFSDAAIESITIGGNNLPKWDGTAEELDIPRAGDLVITFTKEMQDNPVVTINGKRFIGKGSNDNKTFTFPYILDYSTRYNVNVLPPTFRTATGVAFITPIRFSVKTADAEAIEKTAFNFIVDSNLPNDYDFNGIAHGDINAAIVAANAASTSESNRFRIFVPNGTYQIKDNEGATDGNGKTTLRRNYVSIIGQSMDKTIIVNKPTTEGIETTATLELNSTYDVYLQDITLKNNYNDMLVTKKNPGDEGVRAIALWTNYARGTILKNVKLWSNQDTYYSKGHNANDFNTYFETSTITGTVDYICGHGNSWFEQCNLILNDRASNVIVAPSTYDVNTWGFVFNECTIDKAAGSTKVTDGNWWLGRPWNTEPRATFLNTTLNILPHSAGWTNMTSGLTIHLREYGSKDANGNLLDLSSRSVDACAAKEADNPVMTSAEASRYTIDAMFGSNNPRIHTTQVKAPVIGLQSAKVIAWDDIADALCYFVFVDDKLVSIQTSTTYNVEQNGTYTVRAANERGGLGAVSNTIRFTTDIPTVWTFGKETWRNVSTEYWTEGTEDKGEGDDKETLNYQSLKYAFEGITDAENGGQLMESSSIFLQTTNGLKFIVNDPVDDKLRYYNTASKYPKCTGIKANGENITVRIPILKGFPAVKITMDGVNKYILTGATGTTDKEVGDLVPKADLMGYLNYTIENGHTLNAVSLLKNSKLDEANVSQSPIYNPSTRQWTYNITHNFEYAKIKYYTGELNQETVYHEITNPGTITVNGGETFHILVEDGQDTPTLGPSSVTDVTAPSTGSVFNVTYIPDGVLANPQFSEDMNLKISTEYSRKASGILHVDGEFLEADADGTVVLSAPTTGTLTIEPSTFRTDAQGKLDQWFVVYYAGTEAVEQSNATATFKINDVAQNIKKNGKGEALTAYPFTYQRKVAQNSTATPDVVNNSATWDWTKKTGEDINWSTPENDEPNRYEFVAAGNVNGMNDDGIAFDANKLITQGQVQFRENDNFGNHFMGDYIAFKTKVNGTLRLTMGTTNPTAERRLIVKVGGNVVNTNYKMEGDEQIWDNQTWHFNSQNQKTFADIPISGVNTTDGTEVEITTTLYRPETFIDGEGQGDYIPTNEPRPQYFWMYKMEFIADAVAPEITVDDNDGESTWKVTLDTGDSDDYIYYTLDGTEPTTASYRYTEPFDLPTNYTIKAKTLTPGKKASDVSTKECNYQLRHLTVKVPSGHGIINPTPLVESGNYIESFKVELAPKAKMGHIFEKFTSDEEGEHILASIGADHKYTVTDEDEQTVYAWFTNAPLRKTTFIVPDALAATITADGGEATGFTGDGYKLDYLAAPEDYTIFWPGHTLEYWYPSTETETPDADKTKYYPGDASAEEGEPLILYPHFKENSNHNYETFSYRTRNVSVHWDLRTAFGSQVMETNKNGENAEAIRLSTHVNVLNDIVEDVPLKISTNGGFINNGVHEDWCTITEGVEIEMPSGKGATFRLATSSRLNEESAEGTTIDGHHFDSYKEAKDDNNITYFIYSFTTDNTDNQITLRIGDDFGYYKYIEADLPPADRAELTTFVNNKYMGQVKVNVLSEGKEADGTETNRDESIRLVAAMYPRGSQITVKAVRSRYYELEKWQVIAENGDTLDITSNSKYLDDVEYRYRDITMHVADSVLTFDLMNYVKVRAFYKKKEDYYVNFSAGKFASGLPPQQIHNEKGEMFKMPKANQTLYYDGHTLKYWEDGEGNRYDFGQQYVLNKNIVLYPVFEVNKYTLFDLGIDLENKHTDEAIVTWNLTRSTDDENAMLAGPYLNYESTKGVLVSQLHFPNHVGEWIDMPLYIDAKTNYGGGKYAKVNNYATATTCQVNDGTIFTVQVSPNVQIRLTAADGRQITTTDIGGWHQGASGEEGYAVEQWGGQTVGICYYGTKPTRDISFTSDAQYFKSVTARYIHGYYEENGVWKDGQHWVPKLNDDCTVDGVAISEEQNTALHEQKNCKYLYTPRYDTDKMPDVKVTCGANGYVEIIQPTVDNPVAVINLHATDGVLISTYRIDFEIDIPEKPLIKSVTVGGKQATFNGGSFNVSGQVAPSGKIQIEFDHTMSETLLRNFGQSMLALGGNKVLSFNYWNMEDGSYTFSAESSALIDKYGQSCYGYKADGKDAVSLDKLNIHFEVSHTEHTVAKRLFNYVVSDNLSDDAIANLTAKGIILGNADNAFATANNAAGTDRFYIYAPDGDYKLTGNTMIKPDYTSDGVIPAKGDGSRWSESEFANIRGKDFANGITQITRSNVSLIGEKNSSVRLWNLPIIEGISYTSTLAIGQGVTDFYCQDLTLENAFPYQNSMEVQGSGSGAAGRAVAFWDKGNKTVMKNVNMLSWQDTYFSNNAGDMRSYWENCKIAGVVDFLCGDGNLWLEQCELMLRDRSGNNIVAPRQPRTQKWGYVFNKCLISAENTAAAASNEGSYTLGRPWAFSPAATFLYTRMEVKPKAVGWNNMNTDDVLRLHEYMSYNEDGETTVDLTGRSLRDCAPVAGSDDPILTDNNATEYTLAATVTGENDDELFDPQGRAKQRPAVRNFGIDDNDMSWADDELALCYFVYKSETENGEYKLITIETENSFNCEHLGKGWYKVRAANEYGGLGEWTKAVEYKTMESYELLMTKIYRDHENRDVAWSTICLPFNAKVPEYDMQDYPLPENFKVYAATKIQDNVITLKRVHYITAGIGYVVYGYPDTYIFKGSSHSALEYDGYESLLDGNSTKQPVSAAGTNCYTLAYKPNVSGIGFYKFVGNTLAPYRAYLTVVVFNKENEKNASHSVSDAQESAAKKGIRFVFEDFDDAVTGIYENIVDVDNEETKQVIYDLNGRMIRKEDMIKGGVYITNGKKIYVK